MLKKLCAPVVFLWEYCKKSYISAMHCGDDITEGKSCGKILPLLLLYGLALYSYLIFELPLLPLKCVWLAPLFVVINFVLIAHFYKLLYRSEKRNKAKPDKYPLLSALAVGVAVLALHLIHLHATALMRSPDTLYQWQQVSTGIFNDWHPVVHTITLWLFAKIYANQYFVACMFIGLFALTCGWLYYTLRLYNCRRTIVLAILVWINISPVTTLALRILWKDSAFMISVLALTTAMINVYCSNGEWLKKIRNILLLIFLFFYCSFVRHNGIFFTVPILFIMLLPSRRFERKTLSRLRIFSLVTAGVLIGYVILRAMLINAHIIKPLDVPQSFGESVGMIMNMMSEAYVTAPEKVPPEAAEFLSSKFPREKWVEYYEGDFNSIKFRYMGNFFEDITPAGLMKIFFPVLWAAPLECGRAFLHVTSVAWDPYWCTVGDMGLIWRIERNCRWLKLTSAGWIWTATGLYFWLALVIGVYLLLRKGFSSLMLTLPFVCYTVGTALLLMGWDYRFFWAIVCGVPPLLAIATSRWQSEEESTPAPDTAA